MKTIVDMHDEIMAHCRETLRKRPGVTVEDLAVQINYSTHGLPWIVSVSWDDANGKYNSASNVGLYYEETRSETLAEFDAAINGRADDAPAPEPPEEPVVELTHDTPIGAIIENDGKRYRLAEPEKRYGSGGGMCIGCGAHMTGCTARGLSARCASEPECIYVEAKEADDANQSD